MRRAIAYESLVQPAGSSHPHAARSQANFRPISCTRINMLLVRLIRGKSWKRQPHMGQDFPRGVLVAAACGLVAMMSPATSAPLDKNACAKLAQDMQDMKMLEVGKLMQNGAAWAASHLSPADLNLVRQYIDLDEQLKFRCFAPSSLVHLKHIDEDDEESGQGKQAESADGQAKKEQA